MIGGTHHIREVKLMNDLIRKRDIDYISAPIAPVLKGENVHYEYVAFRKQIEDISPVPAIPISVIEQIKAEIGSEMNVTRDQYSIRQNDYCDGFIFAMKQVLEIIDHHIKEYTE